MLATPVSQHHCSTYAAQANCGSNNVGPSNLATVCNPGLRWGRRILCETCVCGDNISRTMGKMCYVCGKLDYLHWDLTFHRFPSNIDTARMWLSILNVKINVESLPKYVRLCSSHFLDKDFEFKGIHMKKFLKKGAMPIPPEVLEVQSSSDASLESTPPKTKKVLKRLSCDLTEDTVGPSKRLKTFSESSGTLTASEGEETFEEGIGESMHRQSTTGYREREEISKTVVTGSSSSTLTRSEEQIQFREKDNRSLGVASPPSSTTLSASETEQLSNFNIVKEASDTADIENVVNMRRPQRSKMEQRDGPTNHDREVHMRLSRTDPFCQSELERYECRNCEFATCLNVSLKNHKDVMHKNLQVDHRLTDLLEGYCCKKCDLHTFSIFIWSRHVCKNETITEKGQIAIKMEDETERGDGLWNVHTCELGPKYVSVMLQHIREVHRKPPGADAFCQSDLELHKCEQCDFDDPLKVSLKNHADLTHKNLRVDHNRPRLPQSYSCTNCNFHTFSIFIWARHVCRKSKIIEKSFTFAQKVNLKSHISYIHASEDKIKWFTCTHCSYKTNINSALKRHIKIKHTPEENIKFFQCDHCLYKAKLNCSLKKHIRIKHTSEENIEWFNCEQCPYKCKEMGNLKKHVIQKHSSEENIIFFHCEHCSYKAKIKSILKRHITRKHTSEENIKWFKCEQCSFKCKENGNLKKHIILEHSLEENIIFFQCEHCSYKTKINSYLKKHIRNKHTSEENIKWFKCKQCPHKCKEMGNLKKHIIQKHSLNENINFFQCQHCSYKAKINSKLKTHLRVKHTSEENIK